MRTISIDKAMVWGSAFFGALLSAMADLIQKEDAAAILKITSISARLLEVPVAPISVVMSVSVCGVLLSFVFQPETRPKAFGLGASVLAITMTMTPYSKPPAPYQRDAAKAADMRSYDSLQLISRAQAASKNNGNMRSVIVELFIDGPNSAPSDFSVDIYVHDEGDWRISGKAKIPHREIFSIPVTSKSDEIRYRLAIGDTTREGVAIISNGRAEINVDTIGRHHPLLFRFILKTLLTPRTF